MKPELVKFLIDVKSEKYMATIILNFNGNDLQTMFNLLDYTDNETEQRWLKMYCNLMKY